VRWLLGTIALAGGVTAGASAAADQAAKPLPVVAVNCTVQAATVFLEPPGKLRVVEYKYDSEKHVPPTSTGRVLIAADATTRTVNPAAPCHRIKAVKKRELGFAGPWRPDVQSRVTCIAPRKDWGLDFQLRPVLNKAKRTIGNRLVVLQKTVLHPTPGVEPKFVRVASADAWVTRSGGGIKFDPTLCARNMYP
jgi:hypothetical protein